MGVRVCCPASLWAKFLLKKKSISIDTVKISMIQIQIHPRLPQTKTLRSFKTIWIGSSRRAMSQKEVWYKASKAICSVIGDIIISNVKWASVLILQIIKKTRDTMNRQTTLSRWYHAVVTHAVKITLILMKIKTKAKCLPNSPINSMTIQTLRAANPKMTIQWGTTTAATKTRMQVTSHIQSWFKTRKDTTLSHFTWTKRV